MLIELENEMQFKDLIGTGVTLVDFNATWCGPCRMLKPVIEETSEEMKDVKFVGVDVDKFERLSATYNVRVVPTLVLFKNGVMVTATSGYRPKESLIAFINSNK